MAKRLSILITAIMAMQLAAPASAGFLEDLAKEINKGIEQALSTSSGNQAQDNANQQEAQAEVPQDLDKLKRRIDALKRNMPTAPSYLYSVDTTTDAIATVWMNLTDKLVSDGARRARYDEFYYTSLDYRNLAQIALGRAEKAAKGNDAWRTSQQLQLVDRYLKLHNLTREGATALYLGHIDEAYNYAKAIYDMSQSLVKLGSAAGKPIIGPYAGYTFDLLFLATDYMIDEANSGMDEAARKAAMKVLVKVAFDAVPLKALNGKTIGQFMTDKTGSYIGKGIATSRRHPIIDELLVSPEFIRAFRSTLAKSASHLTEEQIKKIAAATLNGVWQQLGVTDGNITTTSTTKGGGLVAGDGDGGADSRDQNNVSTKNGIFAKGVVRGYGKALVGGNGKWGMLLTIEVGKKKYSIINPPNPSNLSLQSGQQVDVWIKPLGEQDAWFAEMSEFVAWGPAITAEFDKSRKSLDSNDGMTFVIKSNDTPGSIIITAPGNVNLLDSNKLASLYRDAILRYHVATNRGYFYIKIIINQNNELAVETYTGNYTRYNFGEEELKLALEVTMRQERHHLRSRIEKAKAAQQHSQQVNDSRRRFDDFTKKHGTPDFTSASKLDANPFAFEGNNVLLRAIFREMVSKTDGRIESENRGFILSDIPRARFTDSGPVLVVAKVIGKKQGMTTMKYLDARTCDAYSCKEYLLWRE